MAWADVESQISILKDNIAKRSNDKIVNSFLDLLALLKAPENFKAIPADFTLYKAFDHIEMRVIGVACGMSQKFCTADHISLKILLPANSPKEGATNIEIDHLCGEQIADKISFFELYALALRIAPKPYTVEISSHEAAPKILADAITFAAKNKDLTKVSLNNLTTATSSLLSTICKLRFFINKANPILQNLEIDETSAKLLSAYIQKTGKVKGLDLSNTNMNGTALFEFLKGLRGNPGLKYLNISNNPIKMGVSILQQLMLNFSINIIDAVNIEVESKYKREMDAITSRNTCLAGNKYNEQTLNGIYSAWEKARIERGVLRDDGTSSVVRERRGTIIKGNRALN